MIEIWMILITAMEPNVPTLLQEFVSPRCYERIERIVAEPTTVYARCESRRKIKEKTK